MEVCANSCYPQETVFLTQKFHLSSMCTTQSRVLYCQLEGHSESADLRQAAHIDTKMSTQATRTYNQD